MEINEKNKKIFDDNVEDYRNTYGNEQGSEQLELNAKKFAIGQLIYKAALNKDYTLAYGTIAPEGLKMFDVILSASMFTGEINGFYAVILEDNGGFRACRVKRGDGTIDSDSVIGFVLYND